MTRGSCSTGAIALRTIAFIRWPPIPVSNCVLRSTSLVAALKRRLNAPPELALIRIYQTFAKSQYGHTKLTTAHTKQAALEHLRRIASGNRLERYIE